MSDPKSTETAKVDPPRQLTVNLPPHADKIYIDGHNYHHGGTYVVSQKHYESAIDIMARAWDHEHDVSGQSRRQRRVNPFKN